MLWPGLGCLSSVQLHSSTRVSARRIGFSYIHLMEPVLQMMQLEGHAVAERSTSAVVQSEEDVLPMNGSARVCSLLIKRILLFPRDACWLRMCRNLSERFTVLLGDEYRVSVRFLKRSRTCLRCFGIRGGVDGTGTALPRGSV